MTRYLNPSHRTDLSHRGAVIQSPPFSPSHSSSERRSFEFYFYHAGPSIAGILDAGFWKGVTAELSSTVWDAAMTASSLYETPPHEILGLVAYIALGIPFELSLPTPDQSARHWTSDTARHTLTHQVALCLSYESNVAQHQKQFGHSSLDETFQSQRQNLEGKLAMKTGKWHAA